MVAVDQNGSPAPSGSATHLKFHRGEWVNIILGISAIGGTLFVVMSYLFTTDKRHSGDFALITAQVSEHLALGKQESGYLKERLGRLEEANRSATEQRDKIDARILELMDIQRQMAVVMASWPQGPGRIARAGPEK